MRKLVALVFAITASLLAPSAAFSSQTTQNYVRCIEKILAVLIKKWSSDGWLQQSLLTHQSLTSSPYHKHNFAMLILGLLSCSLIC